MPRAVHAAIREKQGGEVESRCNGRQGRENPGGRIAGVRLFWFPLWGVPGADRSGGWPNVAVSVSGYCELLMMD